MRCQRCGGEHIGGLPGMSCPRCGSVARSPVGNDSWIARETLAGRLSTLSRRRKALLAAGFVVAVGSLATAVSLLAAGEGGGRPEAAGRAGAVPVPIGGGAPTRIGPEDPDLPDPALPGEATPGAPPSTTAEPGRYRYSVWAGPGCTTGVYEEFGRFESGDAGWYTVGSGGFEGRACDGRFVAVPMSGSPVEEGRSSAVWSWHLGGGYRECALTVFVPRSIRDKDVAGDPSEYRVRSDPRDPDSAYTGFSVRQPGHRGTAVAVGTYPVKGDTFAVQLTDRGRDWGDTSLVGAHHAAAQMKASCR